MFLKVSLNILLYILVMTMAYSIDKNARNLEHSVIDFISLNVTKSLHYDVKLSLKPGYVSHGEVNLSAYISWSTRDITLLTSEYINVTEVNLKSDNGEIYVLKRSKSHYKDKVVLNFAEESLENNLKCGFYTLYVNFSNTDTEELSQTLYTHEKEDKKFIATLFQPTKGRPLFPCFNTSDLVSLNISVKHNRRYQVLSNMPIRNQSVSNNVMLTHFHTFPYTYIYEVALILMTSDMTPSDPISFDSDDFLYSKIRINTWSRSLLVPHMKFARHVLGNVTKYLNGNWNIVRRGPKVDCVALPNLEGNIRQTWGLVLYNETYITYNEELYPAYKSTAMRLIVHEIIYQWFDGFFYPWHNYWLLNEGFIKFIEAYIIEKAFPKSRMLGLFTIQDQHEYRHLDEHYFTNINEKFRNNISEFKINSHFIRQRIIGPVVWRMLKSVMPNTVFWNSISKYLTSNSSYNWRIPGNLWDIMQTYINKSEIKNYELNVQKMMNVWAQHKHCPVLNAIRNYNEAYVHISLDKEQTFNQRNFFIPITYTTEIDIDFRIKSSTIDHYLTESHTELKIPIRNQNKWIIVNMQQTGFYRVNYDPENWRRIAHYLNSDDYIDIHVLNRAQIIDDAFHFVMEKQLNSSIFWKLANYLPRRERDYLVWYPMIKALEYLSKYFGFMREPGSVLPSEFQDVSIKIKRMFEYKKNGIHPFLYEYQSIHNPMKPSQSNFNKYLKLDLTKWGCVINIDKCLEMAKNILELYVQNSTLNRIPPGWEEWTYCNGLKTANESMWYTVYLMASRMYKEKSDYKMLEYLGCSENPNIIVKYLWSVIPEFKQDMLRNSYPKMLKQKNKKDKDKIYILTTNMFLSTLARHAKNTLVLKEILTSYEMNYYKNSPVSVTTAFNVLINNAYTYEQLYDEIFKFAKTYMRFSKYKNHIQTKIITRYLKLDEQQQFFHNLFE